MIRKVTAEKAFVADFETSTNSQRTYIWAWAICNVAKSENVIYGSAAKEFFEFIDEHLPNNSAIYFHNLKWDGNFIVHYLLNHDFRQIDYNNDMIPYSFSTLVSDMGIWYSIKIKFKHKEFLILDSLKKLPFKVSDIAKSLNIECKGEIDYHNTRYEWDELSAEDKDYIRRDVQIVAKALKLIFFDNNLAKQTIGSDCMNYYKKTIKGFKRYFPILDDKIDNFCRQAYKGGFCYVDPRRQNKDIREIGCTFDVNSLYPSVMHSQSGYRYPVGEPVYYKGNYKPDKEYTLYIQHFTAEFYLKDGCVPLVQIKNSFRYKENEYLKESYEPVELYMTSVDLDLFFKHYDVINYKPIDGYKFKALFGLFDTYINYWFKQKEEAAIKKDPVLRLTSKLFLNNLYGRFAMSTKSDQKEFSVDYNDVLHASIVEKTRKSVYVPTAAFVTSYARKELITAIQYNYDNFCYCDTDSIHLLGETARGIKIDDNKLGWWKHEGNWDRAKFLRQKTYCERINGKYDYKASGMPDNIKKDLEYDDFKLGAVFNGKLVQKNVSGGCILTETTFEIKDPFD